MCFALAAMSPGDSLPTDLDGLRALLLAERAHHAEELERLTAIIKELQRHRFGRRAERLDPEQLALALEDVEQTLAAADAAAENDTTAQKQATPRRRHINRGALPVHLPREEIVIDVADKTCACCGGLKHRIGEDVSERLDVIPAQFKVALRSDPTSVRFWGSPAQRGVQASWASGRPPRVRRSARRAGKRPSIRTCCRRRGSSRAARRRAGRKFA